MASDRTGPFCVIIGLRARGSISRAATYPPQEGANGLQTVLARGDQASTGRVDAGKDIAQGSFPITAIDHPEHGGVHVSPKGQTGGEMYIHGLHSPTFRLPGQPLIQHHVRGYGQPLGKQSFVAGQTIEQGFGGKYPLEMIATRADSLDLGQSIASEPVFGSGPAVERELAEGWGFARSRRTRRWPRWMHF